MKKRILSILLVCATLLMLLPASAFADYSDGAECANCGHYHWDDHMCKCGLCSVNCTNSDCWYETHCKECGECYMDVSNWCDECGWCENCMKGRHCEDCGRCFVGEGEDELCPECLRCSDCVGAICDECNRCDECAGEEHCANCSAHLYTTAPCGYCDDCATEAGLHCESCGACFEDDAEHCPVHTDEPHCDDCAGLTCESCSRCEYADGIELCPECELCTECCAANSESYGCSTGEVCRESGDWDSHFCEDCGGCFCDKERCPTCGLCLACCAENAADEGCDCGDVCVKSAGWKVHMQTYHGEDGALLNHEHKFRIEWTANNTHHWHECRFCTEMSDYAEHKLSASGKCEVCGYDTALSLFFVEQPKDVNRKVTDGNAEPEDPNSSRNNRAEFSVTAVSLAGEELQFRWYEKRTDKETGKTYTKELKDDTDADEKDRHVRGADTAKLNVAVSDDGCIYKFEYYCIVTSKDAAGKKVSLESRHALLKTQHNYGPLHPITWRETSGSDKGYEVEFEYTDKFGDYYKEKYTTENESHNAWCLGSQCEHTMLPAKTPHNMQFVRYLGYGNRMGSTVTKHLYLWKCIDCGYETVRESDEIRSELIYNITVLDMPNVRIVNEDDEEGLTSAWYNEELYIYAPYLNDDGFVFDHWEVVSGPEGFTDADVACKPGDSTAHFFMPKGDITLRGIYSTDKVPVNSLKIKVIGDAQMVDNVITVREGTEFTVDTVLAPENVATKSIRWYIWDTTAANELFITTESALVGSTQRTVPVEGPISLKANCPGTVRLQAVTYESERNQDDLSYVRQTVYVKILPADAHVHDYTTTVTAPTCTKKGYTLYVCKDASCGKKYMGDIVKPLGHKFENGVCTVCGAKEGEPESPWINPFIDVKESDWFYEGVKYAVQKGMFNGTSANTFSPNDPMTRAMLVTVLWRLDGENAPSGVSGFTDVPGGQWYSTAVAWAAENGIVNGVDKTHFAPNDAVTREQIAAILFRYAEKKGIDTGKRADLSTFPDANQVSGYAKDALAWANAADLIRGSQEGSKTLLLPQSNATRAQVATILTRYAQNIVIH